MTRSLVAGLVAWLAAGIVIAAEPSQLPLLVPTQAGPATSVVLTLDDALDMHAQSLPDGVVSVRGRAVRLPDVAGGERIDAVPDDQGGREGFGPTGVALAEPGGSNAFQRQFRSPDINGAYYDPRVRYRPWPRPEGGRFPPADVAQAAWDPRHPERGGLDLRFNQHERQARWCGSATDCVPSRRMFGPALVYRLKADGDPAEATAFVEYDLTQPGVRMPKEAGGDRTDCAAADHCSQPEELANFANWFSYHRSRWLAQQAAVSEALLAAPERLRVGLASLNAPEASIDGATTAVMRLGVRDADAPARAALLRGVQQAQPSGQRPLHGALTAVGRYFRRGDGNGPWRDAGSASIPACRRAYHVLLAGGRPSDAGAAGNVDGSDGPSHAADNPQHRSPTRYAARRPYADAAPATLADTAMRDYVEDLLPGVPNAVRPGPDDPAYWQHLGQITIGYGLQGVLDPARDLEALTQGSKTWSAEIADDLWHAALDTRGRHERPVQSAALKPALDRALLHAAAAALPPTLAARTATAGGLTAVASHVPGAWIGDVVAYRVDGEGRASGDPAWRASSALPPPGDRKLWTWNRGSGRAERFVWNELSAENRGRLGADAGEALVRYLRGEDRSPYRPRLGPLGDFVNGGARWIGSGPSLRYDLLPGAAGASYRAFVDVRRTRPGLLFAGANDGFLHAFRAADGAEVFGYAPRAVLPQMPLLAAPSYGNSPAHRFFVDGPLSEGDAYVADAQTRMPRWHNVVVGSMGAGAKGLFAIDVDDPAALGGEGIRWERGEDDDADIGHVMNEVEIGMLPDGRWKAFAGNGVYSRNGRAVLLAIDIETGTVDKLLVDGGPDSGLMGVRLLRNAGQQVIGAYAGDLRGRLWRIEMPSARPAEWRVGFGARPLFEASDRSGRRQAFTAAPVAMKHPLAGQIVVLGSGRLLDDGDASDRSIQTVYGIWDPIDIERASGDASTRPPASRADLLLQGVAERARETSGGTFFEVTGLAIDWQRHRGWALDLTLGSGQRVLAPATPLGDFVHVSSVAPGVAGGGCEEGVPRGYGILVQALSGGQYASPVFDTNGDAAIDGGDLSAAIVSLDATNGRAGVRLLPASSMGKADRELGVRQRGFLDEPTGAGRRFQTYCLGPCTRRIADRLWQPLMNPPR